MGVAVIRGLIGGLGLLLMLGGIGIVAAGPASDVFAALFLFLPGALLVAAALLERLRYRSLAAERSGDRHGPGGGESAIPEPRFRPTGERFVDPTTDVPMRVFIDPATGEQRYVAER